MAKSTKITVSRLRALKQNRILKMVESAALELEVSVYLVGGALRNLFLSEKTLFTTRPIFSSYYTSSLSNTFCISSLDKKYLFKSPL